MRTISEVKKQRSIVSHSEKETLVLGENLARQLRSGDIVYLYGELGSGKTVLAKGICKGLDIKDVTSSSFVIVTEYQGRLPVVHIDLYRLDQEAIDFLPVAEYVQDKGITIIEWADRLGKKHKPGICIEITITKKNYRELKIEDYRH